jgi:hypothetical protein
LILPELMCLSQRLSHACLSINDLIVKPRMAHYNSYNLLDLEIKVIMFGVTAERGLRLSLRPCRRMVKSRQSPGKQSYPVPWLDRQFQGPLGVFHWPIPTSRTPLLRDRHAPLGRTNRLCLWCARRSDTSWELLD